MPQPTQQHQEIGSLINELPPELADDPSLGAAVVDEPDEPETPDEPDEPETPDEPDEPETPDDEEEPDEPDNPDNPDDVTTEEDEDDYFTSPPDEEEELVTPPPAPAPANNQPAAPAAGTDEGTYILNNLQKISTRIIVPGENGGEDQIKEVQVYGYGDLPRDFKGFATPWEQGVFSQAVIAQEQRALTLQQQYRNEQNQKQADTFQKNENNAIREDLTDLRKEGVFPKFKGVPGTKEFNESEGAKEFDRVVAYMNEQNDKFLKASQNGKTYRHIGFREAFYMLHGANPNAAQQRQDKARKAAAGKVKTARGTNPGDRKVATTRVTNITDLQDEFTQFAGAGGSN